MTNDNHNTKDRDKGALAEECLRQYFIECGLYVLRAIKIQSAASDMTDIDLWLCGKSTPFLRTRINVDVKNKKTPQAAERIIWTKGIQKSLKLDACIVATTDTNPNIRDFANRHEVILLDGAMLTLIVSYFEIDNRRLSEEEFFPLLADRSDIKRRNWVDRLTIAKSRMIDTLDFNGSIRLLDDAGFFLSQIFESPKDREQLLRYFYFTASLFLISIDFSVHDHAFHQPKDVLSILAGGLMYGDAGHEGFNQRIELAANLASLAIGKRISGANIGDELSRRIQSEGVNKIAEFCSRADFLKDTFSVARSLEAAAFRREFVRPDQLDSQSRSFLSVFLDYKNINRKVFFESFSGTLGS